MAREEIYTGYVANDGTGDTLRVAANKTNNNFSELYSHHANNLTAHDWLQAHTDEGVYLLQGRVNTTIDFANVIFNFANTINANVAISLSKSTSALISSNNVGIVTNSVYQLANTLNVRSVSAYTTTNAAYNKANSALPLTGGTIVGDLVVTGNTSLNSVTYLNPVVYNTANGGYFVANAAYGFANAINLRLTSAYESHNVTASDVYVLTNRIDDVENTDLALISKTDVIFDTTNTAFNRTNTVYGLANTSKQRPVYTIANANYYLSLSDVGNTVATTGTNIILPNSTFFGGNVIFIFNNTASSITVTPNSGVNLHLSGSSSTGSRTIAQHSFAEIICILGKDRATSGNGANTFVITGLGVS